MELVDVGIDLVRGRGWWRNCLEEIICILV